MGHDTRHQVFRPICDVVVECARDNGSDPISLGMGKPKPDCHNHEGEPGKRCKRDGIELFPNQIAKQESAPEDFLDQWNDNDQAQKTEDDHCPVRGWLARKDSGIEAVEPRRKSEEGLRRNPYRENEECNRGGKNNLPGCAKLIRPPKPDEKRAARYRLSRVDPILRRIEPEGAVKLPDGLEGLAHGQQNKIGRHGHGEGHQLSVEKPGTVRICLAFRLDG